MGRDAGLTQLRLSVYSSSSHWRGIKEDGPPRALQKLDESMRVLRLRPPANMERTSVGYETGHLAELQMNYQPLVSSYPEQVHSNNELQAAMLRLMQLTATVSSTGVPTARRPPGLPDKSYAVAAIYDM